MVKELMEVNVDDLRKVVKRSVVARKER